MRVLPRKNISSEPHDITMIHLQHLGGLSMKFGVEPEEEAALKAGKDHRKYAWVINHLKNQLAGVVWTAYPEATHVMGFNYLTGFKGERTDPPKPAVILVGEAYKQVKFN